jgi:glycosyltransferase involved in cell wall biosynthesis
MLYGRRGEPLGGCPPARQRRAYTPAHHRWETLALGVEIAGLRPDLLHALDVVPPFALNAPSVITVHDLAFLRWPELLDADGRRHYGKIHLAVAQAAHIIAVSETTRQDLHDLLGVESGRVTVVPEAPATHLHPLSLPERVGLVRGGTTPAIADLATGRRGPYYLVVGTIEPRKNLPMLLHAYDELVAHWPAAPRLVLAGQRGWHAEPALAALETLAARDRVDWFEQVGDQELHLLYAGALALLFPSLYEGFGLPALEAMACGTPVLAADTAGLREVVGEAGWLLPPTDELAWSDALAVIGRETTQRAALAEAGRARAAGFTWQKTAELTKAVYRRVVRDA